MLREVTAKRSALATYERSADAHRARETQLLMSGCDLVADIHMEAERLLLRAWAAEEADPEPQA